MPAEPLAKDESEDTHQAAYDEAAYVRDGTATRIKELSTLFEDFTADVSSIDSHSIKTVK
jgi:hypothetical protein